MKKIPFHVSAGAIGSVLLVGFTFVGLVTMFGDNIKALFGMSALMSSRCSATTSRRSSA